ncbi:rod shape-determining protein MreC [Candidatus Parcubacteria bacterium]|nr:rod shape-determining protein MreC [Patescibacteria group bacterium]MBU4467083.1 rod shape-determining protein MreC [Patescibacteria group bacterium]MCG2688778.1 rod shape-determining protein MreC [Candidatus Parcubacteria bacterium]
MNKLGNPKKLKTIFLLILAGVIILTINYTSLGSKTKDLFLTASAPLQTLFWQQGQGLSHFIDKLKGISFLEGENSYLKLENQRLKAELANLLELKNENQELRKALDIGLEKEFEVTTANVISKDPFQDVIVIDKGSNDGISVNFPVISPQKNLIGRVEESFASFSRVILTSNKRSSISAKISDQEETIGVVNGESNLKLVFDLVLQDNKIEKGSLVLTTSLGNIFPKGLLIGEIKSINYSDVKPFQTAQIDSGLDLNKLNSVFIITNLR